MQDRSNEQTDPPAAEPAHDLKDLLTGRRRLLQGGAAALAGAAALGRLSKSDAAPSGPTSAGPTPAGHDRVKGGWLGMNRPKA